MISCHMMNGFYVKSCIVFVNTLPYCDIKAAATYNGVWDETLMIFLKNLGVYKKWTMHSMLSIRYCMYWWPGRYRCRQLMLLLQYGDIIAINVGGMWNIQRETEQQRIRTKECSILSALFLLPRCTQWTITHSGYSDSDMFFVRIRHAKAI